MTLKKYINKVSELAHYKECCTKVMTKDDKKSYKKRIVDDNFFLNQQTSANKQNPP